MSDGTDVRKLVERMYKCVARLRTVEPVMEGVAGKVVWQGLVLVFAIEGHPEADICYAFSQLIEGSNRREFYAVLQIPPVDSPQAAVRAVVEDMFEVKEVCSNRHPQLRFTFAHQQRDGRRKRSHRA